MQSDPILALVASLREALGKMTPGPWWSDYMWLGSRGPWAGIEASDYPDNFICHVRNVKSPHGVENMEGIVAIRNALPQLLDALSTQRAALRKAEWNCAPGSGFCPVCHAPEEPMTYGNGRKVKGGHAKSCLLRAALTAPTEGKGGRDVE